jgi:predicted NBD/HSP70 family sugar kinase
VEEQVRLNGQDPALLRRINSAAALSALHNNETLTVAETARLIGVSRRTAEEVVDELAAYGWVAEVPVDPDRPRAIGRPARRFRFQSEAGYVLGIDIGVRAVAAALADLSGAVVAETTFGVTQAMPAARRLKVVEQACEEVLAAGGVTREALMLAGVGTTGIVTVDGVVDLSTRLPGWTGIDLAGTVGQMLGCTVYVDNDCNLAAMAEQWLGAARHVADVIYVQTGRQLGTGILIGGQIHRGRHGAAGEIGAHPTFGWDKLRDRLDRVAAPTRQPGPRSTRGPSRRAAIDRTVREFADRLAQGIAAMVLTLDPDIVVVGGSLAEAGSALTAQLEEELNRQCLRPVRVQASALGERCVVLGAVRLALDHVHRKLFAVDDESMRAAARAG